MRQNKIPIVTENKPDTDEIRIVAELRRAARNGQLKARRERLGVTAKELGAAAGLHAVTIRRVESARVLPDASTALAIAKALACLEDGQ
jgi:DNA-binding XRE family transcriptional regulator